MSVNYLYIKYGANNNESTFCLALYIGIQVGFHFLHRFTVIASTLPFKQVNPYPQPVELTFGPLPLYFVALQTADPTIDHLPSRLPGFSSSSSPGFPLTTESSPASSTALHRITLRGIVQ